jgi:hypothetical protein
MRQAVPLVPPRRARQPGALDTAPAARDTYGVGLFDRLLGRRLKPAATDALLVRGTMLLRVVGESYRQDALRAVARIATDATPYLDELDDYALEIAETEPRRWFRAALVREPDNPVDAGAVAVHASGIGLVGYLSREDAARYRRCFESAAKSGHPALACAAMLTGGESAKRSHGVVLTFSAPGHILRDLVGEEDDDARRDSVERRRGEQGERERSVYEAALAGDTWREIAEAHGYETPSGAYTAARRYAERHGIPPPPGRGRGRRPGQGRDRHVHSGH